MPPFETQISAPGSLAAYTRASLIIPQLAQRDTPGIISELSQLLQRQGGVPDLLPFYHAALNQELMSSSALECGIALPHARLSGVRRLQFALGRLSEPVSWGAKSAWPVQLVFLLAVPATDAACYLHLLGSLARLGQNPEQLAELRSATDAEQMLSVLEHVPVRQNAFSPPTSAC
jgi:mannitol/fructose-specific phosphotransferase system IIA component (Ntr-type)